MPEQYNDFDAIVIGSGISGGWAAKELCEKGLKTLVLERGKMVVHKKDYPTANYNPWDMPHRGKIPPPEMDMDPIVSNCYAYKEDTKHFFVKDNEHPYVQEKPFSWIRGYQVGGKSLLWARQTQRWSPYDFEAPKRDGFAVDWPIRYNDLSDWYSYVEKFVGISGNKDGLDILPDGEFLPAWEMNCAEKIIQQKIMEAFPDRHVVQGRCAHLTQPTAEHVAQGRGQCMARNLCARGCPFGAYFSTNSATLPAAEKTGNLHIKTHSVVDSIIYDEKMGKATGVKVVDALTHEVKIYTARIIFVNASCLNTNLILLNSRSNYFPEGLGNKNGLLGKYIAFHNYRGNITAQFDGPMDQYYYGRRPTQLMMPSFKNVYKQEADFLRGYMVHFSAARGLPKVDGVGAGYKNAITEPGTWHVYMMMQGETIPKESNRVYLSEYERDDWGIPQLVVNVDYDENDEKLLQDFFNEGKKMLEKAGCTQINTWDSKQPPGLDIHEMGGVRMGRDEQTSLLNEYNQLHHCKNVFVTDGACMTSTGNQNPSLTYMALTARAAHFAAAKCKEGEL
ncbi:GMC oxidoreductase [Sediminibacterium sp. TEGAF015]|uniref:GMC oxidoreductase n=1 Tax=Sediminibacterium sp. TEGAF015 TaxID=575378 RepID=UPI0021F98FA3|nr:GMC family oxidoreductase [Sediminibacterium sp. TEGAF015]BDQ10931.1 GMC family oxidoreductase [Sediminibacterium sp. TEGAF015]